MRVNGKTEYRTVINKNLQEDLLKYCKDRNIKSGLIFRGEDGEHLPTAYIYSAIRRIAKKADVDVRKANFHSFINIFIDSFYQNSVDSIK